MVAAGGGHLEVVVLLLQGGAPWNALDKRGRCAGEYAVDGGHQEIVDMLVQFGCEAELVLGLLEKRQLQEQSSVANENYLKQKLEFQEDKILDEAGEHSHCFLDSNGVFILPLDSAPDSGDAVMMEWERPLMEAHAELICSQGGDVLNVGFGMGLIDSAIQRRFVDKGLSTHTIIEAHKDVYEKMLKDGWDKKPGVTILFGRWQVGTTLAPATSSWPLLCGDGVPCPNAPSPSQANASTCPSCYTSARVCICPKCVTAAVSISLAAE